MDGSSSNSKNGHSHRHLQTHGKVQKSATTGVARAPAGMEGQNESSWLLHTIAIIPLVQTKNTKRTFLL